MNSRQFFVAFLVMTRRLSLRLLGVAVYCVGVAFCIWWFSLSPLQWEAEAALVNGLILGLLLGFRNRAAFDRWWEGRRLWGQLINDTRNLAWKLKSYLPAAVVVQARMPAALAGFAEALKRHLRGSVRLQEIPGFEKDPEAPSHVPQHLAGQILSSLAAWHRAGLIDGSTALVLDVHARSLLDICGACERIRNTRISPFYTVLLGFGTLLNILVAPWYTLAQTELRLWGIFPFLLFCYFLLGVELIDADVEEPFGTELNDLDLDRYCETIRQSVTTILSEGDPRS